MVQRLLGQILQAPPHFTHVGADAVVAVAGVKVLLLRHHFRVRHLVVDAPVAAQVVKELAHVRLRAAQLRLAVRKEVVHQTIEEGERRKEPFLRLVAHHHRHGLRVVLRRHRRADFVVALARLQVGANEKPQRHRSEAHGHGFAAPEHSAGDDRRKRARRKSGEEPARNHRENARDAVDRAFSIPGAIRKGRAHRHHEGNVSRRKRQLQARRRGNERRAHHEVHRSANIVKGQRHLALFKRHRRKARADRAVDRHRNDLMNDAAHAHRAANNHATGERRAELLLFAGIRGGEVDRRLHNAVGLLGEPEREDHHET